MSPACPVPASPPGSQRQRRCQRSTSTSNRQQALRHQQEERQEEQQERGQQEGRGPSPLEERPLAPAAPSVRGGQSSLQGDWGAEAEEGRPPRLALGGEEGLTSSRARCRLGRASSLHRAGGFGCVEVGGRQMEVEWGRKVEEEGRKEIYAGVRRGSGPSFHTHTHTKRTTPSPSTLLSLPQLHERARGLFRRAAVAPPAERVRSRSAVGRRGAGERDEFGRRLEAAEGQAVCVGGVADASG